MTVETILTAMGWKRITGGLWKHSDMYITVTIHDTPEYLTKIISDAAQKNLQSKIQSLIGINIKP